MINYKNTDNNANKYYDIDIPNFNPFAMLIIRHTKICHVVRYHSKILVLTTDIITIERVLFTSKVSKIYENYIEIFMNLSALQLESK